MSGRSCRSILLETPFMLRTKELMDILGWVLHQKVVVIFLPVALDHLRFKVIGHASEVIAQPLKGITIKHIFSIFCHKDQVYVHRKNTMPT